MRSLFSWDVTPGMFDDKEIHVVYSQISQSGLNQDVFFAVLLVVSTDSKIEDKHIADVVSEAFATPTSIYHSVGQKYLMSGHFYFILFFFFLGGGCFSFGGTVQYIEESNIYLCFVVCRLKRGLVT